MLLLSDLDHGRLVLAPNGLGVHSRSLTHGDWPGADLTGPMRKGEWKGLALLQVN